MDFKVTGAKLIDLEFIRLSIHYSYDYKLSLPFLSFGSEGRLRKNQIIGNLLFFMEFYTNSRLLKNFFTA